MIRKWEEKDIDEIAKLIEELNSSLGEDFFVSVDLMKIQFNSMNNNEEIYENFIYEKDGIIIGFISLLFYESIYHKKGSVLVNELVVSNSYRNIGIGKELIKYAIGRAKERNMDEIEVGVMKENKEAIEFYKKNGISNEYYLLEMEF